VRRAAYDARTLYEDCCARDETENRIGEQSSCGQIAPPRPRWQPISRAMFCSDRLSWSMQCVASCCTTPQFANAGVATIRVKLPLLGTSVVFMSLSSSCPNQHEFETAYLAFELTFSSP
jgi:hypothetical protein